MKVFKWLFVGVLLMVLLIGGGALALVYLVDWNDFRDTIQNQAKKHTGRDLVIAGDLKPTVFPFIGVSIGDIKLSNAEGFGDLPFAKMGGADVKVELMPLLKKEVNVKTIELKGLSLDLQRAADGSTNWDDLTNASSSSTEVADGEKDVEVEGEPMAIAALAVGGILISDANVSWKDMQSGTDARLSNFNMKTGAIELAKPFNLSTDFKMASNSMGLAADVNGSGDVKLDLENQVYSLSGLSLNTKALGDAFPGGQLDTSLSADVMAKLAEQSVSVKSLALGALGLTLNGNINVSNLDTSPAISGQLASNEFSPLEMFNKLGIDAPTTADASVLSMASVSLDLKASANSATLDDLTIKLDDSTFNGNASIPSLAGGVPPVRFNFAVDAIDLDRYLPPVVEGTEAGDTQVAASSGATGDEPIALPLEMMRELDIEGEFRVGSVKVKNLTTRDIVVPLTAKDGRIALNGLKANMYQGQLNSNIALNASGAVPSYAVAMTLDGIEADPLLVDLRQKPSFLSGNGRFEADITTTGDTVNTLTSALNGTFSSAFNDGSINGVNLAYQIRRAKAAISGQSLSTDESQLKTDFTALSVGGRFSNGVMQSDDLDLRSPLLRVSGLGKVDLPAEYVDYTVTTLVTGSSQGQGGKDLDALKGVKLDIPIRGSFDELSTNFAAAILAGLKDNITNNLKNKAEAAARAEAEKLKQQAQERLKAEEEKARARLAKEEAKAREKLNAEKAKVQEKLNAQKAAAQDKAKAAVDQNKDKIKGALNNLFK